ncbi:endoplasmic reticulum-Golgi intermediate compartment protein 1-like isoform X2 [Amblyomma americanum]
MSPELVSELSVDNPSSTEKIPVSINITLLKLDCSVVGLDIQDDMGRDEAGFVENSEKTRAGFGCRFEGKFFTHKVPGKFHVSTHAAAKQPEKIYRTHIIHDPTFVVKMTDEVKGSFNSLDEIDKSGANELRDHPAHGSHHACHLVPLRPHSHHSQVHTSLRDSVQLPDLESLHGGLAAEHRRTGMSARRRRTVGAEMVTRRRGIRRRLV